MIGSPPRQDFGVLRGIARSLGEGVVSRQHQRIQAGLLRVFDATFLASDDRPNVIRRERYQLMRCLLLWKDSGSF